MPLLDHFHAPHPRHSWEAFRSLWCAGVLRQLNVVLPPRFYGQMNVQLGFRVAREVAEFDIEFASVETVTIDAVFPDDIEVQIFDTRDGAVLVAVVELASPANKDREEYRSAFAAKSAAYLQRGIGLVIADTVSSSHFNLHNALMELLDQPAASRMADEAYLYATAYRPVSRKERNEIDVWMTPLALGQPLPTLPLALRGSGCVPLDLEASYAIAREMSGI